MPARVLGSKLSDVLSANIISIALLTQRRPHELGYSQHIGNSVCFHTSSRSVTHSKALIEVSGSNLVSDSWIHGQKSFSGSTCCMKVSDEQIHLGGTYLDLIRSVASCFSCYLPFLLNVVPLGLAGPGKIRQIPAGAHCCCRRSLRSKAARVMRMWEFPFLSFRDHLKWDPWYGGIKLDANLWYFWGSDFRFPRIMLALIGLVSYNDPLFFKLVYTCR